MTLRMTIAALAAASTSVLWALEKDEVGYEPRAYTPRKTMTDATYKPRAYSPATRERSIGKPAEPARSTSRWSFFKREKPLADTKKLHDAELSHAEPYVQRENISVPTTRAGSRDIPEKAPFDDKGKRAADTPYKPDESPRPKNPLLVPRQGIKAPASGSQ